MTHTPGPWTISQSRGLYSGEARNLYTVSGACGTVCTTPNPSVADNAANARLIAAAPELLDAMREMLRQFADHEQYDEDGYDTAAINKARAAIARATGGDQ